MRSQGHLRSGGRVVAVAAFAAFVGCGSDNEESGGLPTGSAVDPSTMLRAAVFYGSCLIGNYPNIDSAIVDLYDRHDVSQLGRDWMREASACFRDKTNGCQAVVDCVGISLGKVDKCTEGCSGDVAVLCLGLGSEFRQDCTKVGASCIDRSRPTCTRFPSAAVCEEGAFIESCQDDHPVFCTGAGVISGPKCTEIGLVCSSANVCSGNQGACDGFLGPYGEYAYVGVTCMPDGKLQACVNKGLTTRDCATVGPDFRCQLHDGDAFCGIAAECSPRLPTTPSCDGNSVVVCNAGKIEKVDCTALGFGRCIEPGPSSARCVP